MLWDNAIVSNGDKGEVIEVPLILQENISTSTNPKIKDYHRLLFIKKENNHYETKYIQVFTADSTYNNLDKKFNYYSIKDNFNGSIYVLNAKAKSGTSLKFKKSKRIIQNITAKFNEPEEATCLYVGWSYPDGSFEPIMLLGCYGGTGGGGDLEIEYFPESTGEYGGGGGSSTTTTEPVVVYQIINELTGKAKCINDLLDKKGDSFIQNLLANFEGTSEFNIQIVSKDQVFSTATGLQINGETTYSPETGSTLINIAISTSRTESHSLLEAARIIMHEYIHADIFRKLNTIYDANGALDFKKTYEASGNQHGTIAGLYLNSMKEALKAFHKNVLTEDYNKYTNYFEAAPSDAFYEAMAWGGLKDNDINAWNDLSVVEKAAIESLPCWRERLARVRKANSYPCW